MFIALFSRAHYEFIIHRILRSHAPAASATATAAAVAVAAAAPARLSRLETLERLGRFAQRLLSSNSLNQTLNPLRDRPFTRSQPLIRSIKH